MSTYLVAFFVGEVDYVEQNVIMPNNKNNVIVRVYTPKGKKNTGKFSLKLASETLVLFSNYFTIDYPLPKLDMIGLPDFASGAMENWGLVTYRSKLLYVEETTSKVILEQIASVICHELAHQWFGNLVTMQWWTDLWLNEGYTTYFERRIMEEIAGKDYNEMMWELGYQDMQSDLNDMGLNSEDTKLKIDLKKRHPEDAFSNIAYEKGAIFLRMLEENMGRTAFDKYLNQYFQTNAFVPMTTEKALTFMRQHLFNGDSTIETKLLLQQWIYEPGLPGNCPKINPIRFIEVDKQRTAFEQSGKVENLKTSNWTTHEWLQFLRKLPHPFAISRMELLDTQFQLTNTSNSEIADEWFKLSISSNYEKAFAKMEVFLSKVGRKKFLQPLYSELMSQDKYKPLAKKLFEKYKNNYHPQTAEKISDIVNPQK
jgi:hypothetical protein